VNIIERAAELLGSTPPSQQKPAPGPAQHRAEDRIQRMATDAGQRRQTPARAERIEASISHDGTSRSAGTARILKISRDRLLAQGMITPDGGRTPIGEGFRRIKRQVLAKAAEAGVGKTPANLVLVTSALPGEGKTFCAINLAISVALEMDRTVLLVDADVAKPSVPRTLGLEVEGGLMEVLEDRSVRLADVLLKTDIGSLSILPAGKAHRHSTELLASEAMQELLREMAARYPDRIIVFDSPPLLAASEAGALASQMGQIVVVVESGRTSETVLKDALVRVDNAKVTGLLLNKVEGGSLGYGYDGYG